MPWGVCAGISGLGSVAGDVSRVIRMKLFARVFALGNLSLGNVPCHLPTKKTLGLFRLTFEIGGTGLLQFGESSEQVH